MVYWTAITDDREWRNKFLNPHTLQYCTDEQLITRVYLNGKDVTSQATNVGVQYNKNGELTVSATINDKHMTCETGKTINISTGGRAIFGSMADRTKPISSEQGYSPNASLQDTLNYIKKAYRWNYCTFTDRFNIDRSYRSLAGYSESTILHAPIQSMEENKTFEITNLKQVLNKMTFSFVLTAQIPYTNIITNETCILTEKMTGVQIILDRAGAKD